jgi:hypothetical protein
MTTDEMMSLMKRLLTATEDNRVLQNKIQKLEMLLAGPCQCEACLRCGRGFGTVIDLESKKLHDSLYVEKHKYFQNKN